MPKREGQKLKLLRLLQLFYEHTDESVGLTMPEIISGLSELGISAERKSIYDDLFALDELGFTVEKLDTHPVSYTLTSRIFELAELKLLVDAVQSSKFITEAKSRELIDKLKLFAGKVGRGELSRSVWVEGRAKTMNKATIYTIDSIHKAINESLQISFRYFSYDSEKKKQYRHGGERYKVSPISLIWSDENYYLVAFDESIGERRNYRVDKMESVMLEDEKRSEEALSYSINSADYSQKVFGMYDGEERLVTLECKERLANVIIDRFGNDHTFVKVEGGFRVSVRVIVSPIFFAWVMGFGSGVKIISPSEVRDEFLRELRLTLSNYDGVE